MRTGRLSISRGHRSAAAPTGPRLSLVAGSGRDSAPSAPAISPEYRPVHDRLDALERLARLHEQGALSDEEFAGEKARILAGETLVLNEPLLAPARPRGPTLLGRLFGWRFIPVGIVAGLALSFAAQPRDTMRFLDEIVRLFGA